MTSETVEEWTGPVGGYARPAGGGGFEVASSRDLYGVRFSAIVAKDEIPSFIAWLRKVYPEHFSTSSASDTAEKPDTFTWTTEDVEALNRRLENVEREIAALKCDCRGTGVTFNGFSIVPCELCEKREKGNGERA